MTTAYTPTVGISGLVSPTRSDARSDWASLLQRKQEEIRRHLLDSYSISSGIDRILSELRIIQQDASRDGWDGYNAKALNHDAYDFAVDFLEALPISAPMPEISADNDGEVALDWIFGSRKALTVSIGPGGRCTFAWIYGQSTSRGTEWITDEIPANIARALAQLASETAKDR